MKLVDPSMGVVALRRLKSTPFLRSEITNLSHQSARHGVQNRAPTIINKSRAFRPSPPLLLSAERTPEEIYTFKPTDADATFGEMG